MSDAEHELLVQTTEQGAEIERLRHAARRAARAAITAQERADGTHEPWLDELVHELDGASRAPRQAVASAATSASRSDLRRT